MSKKRQEKPSRIAEAFLYILLPEREKRDLLGDHTEYFRDICVRKGRFIANFWYWMQIVNQIPKTIWNSTKWSLVMIRHYLKIAFINLIKHACSSTVINIIGLALGIACSVLVLLFVIDELSYDRFHENADRIYRIAQTIHIDDRQDTAFPTPPILGPTLVQDFPEVLMTTRVHKVGRVLVTRNDQTIEEPNVYAADSDFFNVFSFELRTGDPDRALAEPNSVIITASTAQKYFGEADPIGEILKVEDDLCTVTGIAEDVPHNSHFHYDFLVSINTYPGFSRDAWLYGFCATYIVLQEDASPQALEARFPAFVKKYLFEGGDSAGIFKHWEYYLQPLKDIHLHSDLKLGEFEPGGEAAYVGIFSVISIFILLIACINFVNLTTAKSAARANEVGIRKVVGCRKSQLICQFLGESVVFSLMALLMALLLMEILLPIIRNLTGKPLAIPYGQGWVLPALLGLGILVGLVSGVYPAFLLSAFKPVTMLKTGSHTRESRRSPILGHGLIVFQFTLSILLLIGTAVVTRQFRFLQNRQLGFDKEHVLVLKNVEWLGSRWQAFRQELRRLPGIIAVSATSSMPGRVFSKRSVWPEDVPNGIVLEMIECDPALQQVLQLNMADGRFFSRNFPTDTRAILLNEEAVQQLGWQKPLGKQIKTSRNTYDVIGVVQDFHFESLHQKIKKMGIFMIDESTDEYTDYLCVRIRPGDIAHTIARIEKSWTSFMPDLPLDFSFLDADLDHLYRTENQTRRMITLLTLLAIFISCLGLLGMAVYMTSQRKKEVGIRKVLGASVPEVTGLLTKDITGCVLTANIIAWPVAYYLMNKWLQNFAYRTHLNIWIFLLSGLAALAVALLTVSYQTIKAATTNPIDSLRYE